MKYLSTLFLFFNMAIANGQTILTLSATPSQPTPNDHVKVIIDLAFPSGGCSFISEQHSINGNTITAFVYHCLGPLSYICNISDTIDLGPLPTGSYTLETKLMAGAMGTNGNCNSFTETDQYNMNLSVSQTTGITELTGIKPQLIFDPTTKDIRLRTSDSAIYLVDLLDLTGKIVFSTATVSGKLNYPQNLNEGLYIYTLRSTGKPSFSGKLFLN